MINHLILSGGVGHSFDVTSAVIAELLADVCARAGQEVHTTIAEDWAGWTDPCDLVTVNGARWRMLAERYAPVREAHQFFTPPALVDAFVNHLAAGGSVLAVHTAMMCFDDWPEWAAMCGATWDWDRSFFPTWAAAVHVRIEPRTRDASVPSESPSRPRDFDVSDECYHSLRVTGERDVLATATVPLGCEPQVVPPAGWSGIGEPQPVVWARSHGGGRVGVDTLGHDHRSLDHPAHEVLLRALIRRLLNLG